MYLWGGKCSFFLIPYENEKLQNPEDLGECFVGFRVNSFLTFYETLRAASYPLPSLPLTQTDSRELREEVFAAHKPCDFLSSAIDRLGLFINLLITQMFYLGAFFVNHIYNKRLPLALASNRRRSEFKDVTVPLCPHPSV